MSLWGADGRQTAGGTVLEREGATSFVPSARPVLLDKPEMREMIRIPEKFTDHMMAQIQGAKD
jgi:hypothetical protein